MGAGFFLCPPERKDGQMDGLQEGAGLGEEGAAQQGGPGTVKILAHFPTA